MQNHEDWSQSRFYCHRAEQDLDDEQYTGGVRGAPGSRLQTPGPSPRQRSEGQYQHRNQRGHQPVTPLDDGGYLVQGWKQMAVAQWPVVSAPHPRATDAHDGSQHDEQVGADSRYPGECDEAFGHGSYDMAGNRCVSRRWNF